MKLNFLCSVELRHKGYKCDFSLTSSVFNAKLVSYTQIWNRVTNFETRSRYPDLATNR